MVAYNFQKQFAGLVSSGSKTQTIRGNRKRHAKVGEPVQLYTGMRTKKCKKLIDPDPICTSISRIKIKANGAYVMVNRHLQAMNSDEFAQADGFADFAEMSEWFKSHYGLPFNGVLIRWEMYPE